MNKKPVAFNYRDYVEAVERNERLTEVNKKLQDENIKQRIIIDNLKNEVSQLRSDGSTATDIIEYVKSKVCKELCKQNKECWEALEKGEKFDCVMDLL